jgi:hypothetical protein
MRMESLTCPQCERTVDVPAKERWRRKFCSHGCAFKAHADKVRAAAATPEARTKRADARRHTGKPGNYVKRNGRHEHRVVAEQKIGRPLRPGEIVHHRDEIKSNNDPMNLSVLPSQSEHARLHFNGMKRIPRTNCKYGHLLDAANVYETSTGRRRCLKCRRDYDNAWKKTARRARGLRRPGPKPNQRISP